MKSTKYAFGRALLILAALFAVTFGMTGCQQDDDDDNGASVVSLSQDSALIGTWTSEYGEIFTITKDTLSNGGSWGDCYAGNGLKVQKLSDTAGYIYIKYTRSANADYTYSETAPDVGKWYAISYKGLTSSTVQLSAAYKADGKTSTSTIDEAVKEFTIENSYFSSYSTCTK